MINAIPLQKRIADSGHCSRREAEKLIRNGKVKVNDQVARLGERVREEDVITIGKKTITPDEEKVYIIINKPEGYVCSNRKFKGEKNIFDLLLEKKGRELKLKHRLFVVGRLDKNSHGLVLVTNDGELTHQITHPRFQHEKEYKVRIKNYDLRFKNGSQKVVEKLMRGIRIDGKLANAKKVEYLGNGEFKIILTQGIKRQIREMFKALRFEIKDIKRTRIHVGQTSIGLGDLKKGKWRRLRDEEIAKLKV